MTTRTFDGGATFAREASKRMPHPVRESVRRAWTRHQRTPQPFCGLSARLAQTWSPSGVIKKASQALWLVRRVPRLPALRSHTTGSGAEPCFSFEGLRPINTCICLNLGTTSRGLTHKEGPRSQKFQACTSKLLRAHVCNETTQQCSQSPLTSRGRARGPPTHHSFHQSGWGHA